MSAVGYPQRIQSAHVESIDGELCIYDTAHLRVHSLNRTAAFVWQRCDGRTAPGELAAALSADASIDDAEAVVQLTLQQLAAAQLLAAPLDEVAVVSRRDLLRRGVAGAAIPAIYSIVAPTPAAAQSVAGGTATFAFTGADDTFVVPAGVVKITIVATGAQGGAGSGTADGVAGLGGRTTATVPVTPGASLTVRVGGAGMFGIGGGGFNGGGVSTGFGGGGGGASNVRDGSTPLVVVGGGGGAATGETGTSVGGNGGAGGGLIADDGVTVTLLGGQGGGGGTQSAGGAGGTGAEIGVGSSGTAGVADTGGTGGRAGNGVIGGGGGGGGYFGGGGGGCGNENDTGGGGGGGGSSFTAPGATAVVHEQGVNSGNGSVTISW